MPITTRLRSLRDPVRSATHPVIAALILLLSLPNAAVSCPVRPPSLEVVIEPSLSSLRHVALEVRWFYTIEDSQCFAQAKVSLSDLPAASIRPHPSDFAGDIAPVLEHWGVHECHVSVRLWDDIDVPLDDSERCWFGIYAYAGDAWWPRLPDRACWPYTD